MFSLRQMLGFGNPLLRSSPKSRRRDRKGARLSVESLECRSLLSVSVSNGTILIEQTSGKDGAAVRVVNNRYVVTESTPEKKFVDTSFTPSQVYAGSIRYFGYGGDDSFSNYTSLVATAYGGSGNDTIQGGNGGDTLYGGAGNDTIQGGSGGDTLYGDAGNDIIRGGRGTNSQVTGNDRIYGGSGNDMLVGYDGDDIISGELGDDRIYGEANVAGYKKSGNDKLYGGAGDDWIQGGSGDDLLSGNDGNDNLKGESGNDTVYGGAGQDMIYGGTGNNTLDGGGNSDNINCEYGNDAIKRYRYQVIDGFDRRNDRLF